MRRFTLHGAVDARKIDDKGENAYQIDTTSYVSVKSRCMALEQSTDALANFRASRYGREIMSEVNPNTGEEVFDPESQILMSHENAYDSTDYLYVDKMDTMDKVQSKAEEINQAITDTVNANLMAEQNVIKSVANAKKARSQASSVKVDDKSSTN